MYSQVLDDIISQMPTALHPHKVYVIKDGNAYKIGVSRDVPRRFREVQTCNPRPLTVLMCLRGGYDTEKAVHALFASVLLHDEWYSLEADHLNLLEALAPALERFPLRSEEGAGRRRGYTRHGRTVPGETQLWALYREMAGSSPRDHLIADLVLRLGMSAAHVVRLTWATVDWKRRVIGGAALPKDVALRLAVLPRVSPFILARERGCRSKALNQRSISNRLFKAQDTATAWTAGRIGVTHLRGLLPLLGQKPKG